MSHSKHNVLHIIPSFAKKHGGPTTFLTDLISGLSLENIDCDIATSDDDGNAGHLAVDAPERSIKGRHYFKKKFNFYTYTPQMAPWLNANLPAYDLVHIHGLFSHVNAMAGRLCRQHKIPYLVTLHGMANKYGMRHKPIRKFISFNLLERQLLEHAAFVHLTSEREKTDFSKFNIKTTTRIIPPGVKTVMKGNKIAPHDLGIPNDASICIFMGRLHPIKNIESIFSALAEPSLENHHLLMCGQGDAHYEEKLKHFAHQCGVENRIKWLGFVGEENKFNLLASSDVFIQPSFSESFGMAAIEAAAAGVPCVLSHHVANGKNLETASIATLVHTSSDSIAAGILSATKLKNDQFSLKSMAYIQKHYSLSNVAKSMADLYNQIINNSVSEAAVKQ